MAFRGRDLRHQGGWEASDDAGLGRNLTGLQLLGAASRTNSPLRSNGGFASSGVADPTGREFRARPVHVRAGQSRPATDRCAASGRCCRRSRTTRAARRPRLRRSDPIRRDGALREILPWARRSSQRSLRTVIPMATALTAMPHGHERNPVGRSRAPYAPTATPAAEDITSRVRGLRGRPLPRIPRIMK